MTTAKRRRAQQEELKAAKEELAYWETIFKPIGYRVSGWTYKNTAQVISPTGYYLSVDKNILELIDLSRKYPYLSTKE